MRRHGEKIRVGSTKASLSFSLSEGEEEEEEEEEEDVALRNSEECEYGKCKTMWARHFLGCFCFCTWFKYVSADQTELKTEDRIRLFRLSVPIRFNERF